MSPCWQTNGPTEDFDAGQLQIKHNMTKGKHLIEEAGEGALLENGDGLRNVRPRYGQRRASALPADDGSHCDERSALLPGLPDEIAFQCMARVPDVKLLRGVCRQWNKVIDTSEEFLATRAIVGKKPIDWLYVLVRSRSGNFSWHAYDPLSSAWHDLPPMPEEVDFQLTSPGCIGLSHQVQCVSSGKKIVMLAGLKLAKGKRSERQWSPLEPALEHPWIFDPRKRLWKKGPRFGTPRRWCACGVMDSKVYVASGCGTLWDSGVSKSIDVYDPQSDVWETLPVAMENSKFSGEPISAVGVEGKLYMVTGKGSYIKLGAVFCSESRTWSRMPESLKLGWVGSCVGVNDRFYVVDHWTGKLSAFDTGANRWEVVMEDPKLVGLVNVTSGNGVICGRLEQSAGMDSEGRGGCLRIINVNSNPPTIRDLDVPQGRIVSIQILERLNLS